MLVSGQIEAPWTFTIINPEGRNLKPVLSGFSGPLDFPFGGSKRFPEADLRIAKHPTFKLDLRKMQFDISKFTLQKNIASWDINPRSTHNLHQWKHHHRSINLQTQPYICNYSHTWSIELKLNLPLHWKPPELWMSWSGNRGSDEMRCLYGLFLVGGSTLDGQTVWRTSWIQQVLQCTESLPIWRGMLGR